MKRLTLVAAAIAGALAQQTYYWRYPLTDAPNE